MSGVKIYYNDLPYSNFVQQKLVSHNKLSFDIKNEYVKLLPEIREFLHSNTLSSAFNLQVNDFLHFENRSSFLDAETITKTVEKYKDSPLEFYKYHKQVISNNVYNHILSGVKVLKFDNKTDSKNGKYKSEFFENIQDTITSFTDLISKADSRFTPENARYFAFQQNFAQNVKTADVESYNIPYKLQKQEFLLLREASDEAHTFLCKLNDIILKSKIKPDLEKVIGNTKTILDNITKETDNFIHLTNFFGLDGEKRAVSAEQQLILQATEQKGLKDIGVKCIDSITGLRDNIKNIIEHLKKSEKYEALLEIKEGPAYEAFLKTLHKMDNLNTDIKKGRY